ncbi:Piso0_001999 [Millerozyma farinosa CBS 7064]|uniref:Transcription initiation factor TFIID subunit 8 n=1 Tax=Pichia sorbitophila (strain ATCC MYA-4447 / BCRC 22081 / CBS 7064 / NBRC 10061 / NRRL Y-12695) TaxID=559304 RepID=G8YBF0_PICSO|nr:Piso0_001999 [Millerozyma farinosa CBS 7064]
MPKDKDTDEPSVGKENGNVKDEISTDTPEQSSSRQTTGNTSDNSNIGQEKVEEKDHETISDNVNNETELKEDSKKTDLTYGDKKARIKHWKDMSKSIHLTSVDTPRGSHPLEIEFNKAVGVILNSRGYRYTESFHSLISDFGGMYFDGLIQGLHKLTESQRRKKPSTSDLKLCFKLHKIQPSSLYIEYEKDKFFQNRINPRIQHLRSEVSDIGNNLSKLDYSLDEQDPSLHFFANEHYEIAELVPREIQKPDYIPSYLPDLPPDYTYKRTPQYLQKTTDLKELRIKLVEESRLTENSLYRLIDDDDRKWTENFEKELNQVCDEDEAETSNDDAIMSDFNQEKDIESPAETVSGLPSDTQKEGALENKELVIKPPTEKPHDTQKATSHSEHTKFDIVEYARRRASIKRRKLERIERKRKLRESNPFIQAEEYFSPFAKKQATPEIRDKFNNEIISEFQKTVSALRRTEIKRKRELEQLLAEREKQQLARAQERDNLEFHFNFDDNKDSSDESDMDNELEAAITDAVPTASQDKHNPDLDQDHDLDDELEAFDDFDTFELS